MERPKLTRASLWAEVRDYLVIGIGMLSYSIGWGIFLLPNSIVSLKSSMPSLIA